MNTKPPLYRLPPIKDCVALGWVIGVPVDELLRLAGQADGLYFIACRKRKKDGTFRDCYAAREPLKSVHKKILNRILKQVQYPAYLMGGVKGGDYIKNAHIHAGAMTLIQEDISSFYPSTSMDLVARTFRMFFNFPPDVATCLAKLCTYRNSLVQGASPSTYLANLVLWDRESIFEAKVRAHGWKYSRYVDDITISSRRVIPTHEKTKVVESVYRLLRSYGYQPKRSKQAIASSGQKMTLHNLNIDRTKPTISKELKKQLRAAVFQIENQTRTAPADPQTWKRLLSTRSKISVWRRLNPMQAKELWDRTGLLMDDIKHLHLSISAKARATLISK